MKARIYQGVEYAEVDPDFLIALIRSGPSPNYRPYGRYLAHESNDVWTAVDNETGDAWAECFYSRTVALNWLCTDKYGDTEYAHQVDEKAHRAMTTRQAKEKQWRPS